MDDSSTISVPPSPEPTMEENEISVDVQTSQTRHESDSDSNNNNNQQPVIAIRDGDNSLVVGCSNTSPSRGLGLKSRDYLTIGAMTAGTGAGIVASVLLFPPLLPYVIAVGGGGTIGYTVGRLQTVKLEDVVNDATQQLNQYRGEYFQMVEIAKEMRREHDEEMVKRKEQIQQQEEYIALLKQHSSQLVTKISVTEQEKSDLRGSMDQQAARIDQLLKNNDNLTKEICSIKETMEKLAINSSVISGKHAVSGALKPMAHALANAKFGLMYELLLQCVTERREKKLVGEKFEKTLDKCVAKAEKDGFHQPEQIAVLRQVFDAVKRAQNDDVYFICQVCGKSELFDLEQLCYCLCPVVHHRNTCCEEAGNSLNNNTTSDNSADQGRSQTNEIRPVPAVRQL